MVSGWISHYVHRTAHVLPIALGGSNHGKINHLLSYVLRCSLLSICCLFHLLIPTPDIYIPLERMHSNNLFVHPILILMFHGPEYKTYMCEVN